MARSATRRDSIQILTFALFGIVAAIAAAMLAHWLLGQRLDAVVSPVAGGQRGAKTEAPPASAGLQLALTTAAAPEPAGPAKPPAAPKLTLEQAVQRARKGVGEKEAAWSRFYEPSPNCMNPDRRGTVDCANEYIRAKTDFEQRWNAGALR